MLRVTDYSPPSTSRNRPLRRILAVTGLIGLLTLVLLLPHPHNFLPGQGSLFPRSISRYASRPGLLRHYQAVSVQADAPSNVTIGRLTRRKKDLARTTRRQSAT